VTQERSAHGEVVLVAHGHIGVEPSMMAVSIVPRRQAVAVMTHVVVVNPLVNAAVLNHVCSKRKSQSRQAVVPAKTGFVGLVSKDFSVSPVRLRL
jgi:hypothetical protein